MDMDLTLEIWVPSFRCKEAHRIHRKIPSYTSHLNVSQHYHEREHAQLREKARRCEGKLFTLQLAQAVQVVSRVTAQKGGREVGREANLDS